MGQVDFAYMKTHCEMGRTNVTIYRMCFQKILDVVTRHREEPEAFTGWPKMVQELEAVFVFLVEQGEKFDFNVNSILDIPDSSGGTCFASAAACSEKICSDLIERGIKLNNITADMVVPDFLFPDLAIPMMERGVNPYVISCDGTSNFDRIPTSFQSEEAQKLVATFRRSIHYSIDDINCDETCPPDCSSKFENFFYKNGPLIDMTDETWVSENLVGSGGFSWVFRQKFHGEPMAMKCSFFEKTWGDDTVQAQVTALEENISELRIQSATAGSGVIVPVAFVRQQDQEQDENGNLIACNYNIYIYPLYNCNLYELHEKHYDQFSENVLNDILNQCLTRIGSKGMYVVGKGSWKNEKL